MNDCGVNCSSSKDEFDPSEPSGQYKLNIASEYDMRILFDLVKIVLEGNGSFKSDSIKIDGKTTTLNAVTLHKYFEARILDVDVDTASSDALALPSKGVLEFTFLSTMLMPGDGKEMPDARMAILREVISLQTDFEFNDSFNTRLKGFHLSADQSRTLLRMIPAENETRRVMCVEACIHKLSNPHLRNLVLQDLNDSEYQMVQKQLGLTAFSFTPANPTGFYRLDLSKDSEREVALNLLRFKNTQEKTEKDEWQATVGRMGGRRPNFDRIFLNFPPTSIHSETHYTLNTH